MARIPNGTFKNWADGDVVHANEYMQELEIIRTAINSTDDDVVILKNASSGTIKRVPSGTAFPTNPTPVVGDVFYRTDHDLFYILGSNSQWRAESPKWVVDAHIANTTNPHNTTATQVGAYSMSESDTKYEIESGTGAAGHFYTKFPDGTLICRLRVDVTMSCGSAYGSAFTSATPYVWNFPVPFVNLPSVTIGEMRWGTSASWGSVQDSNGTFASLRLMDMLSKASGTVAIGAIAIGRWK